VIRLAAIFAILLSFCPKFACLIGLIPTATIGGVSLILYGMLGTGTVGACGCYVECNPAWEIGYEGEKRLRKEKELITHCVCAIS